MPKQSALSRVMSDLAKRSWKGGTVSAARLAALQSNAAKARAAKVARKQAGLP